MSVFNYKGYTITALPYRDSQGKFWLTKICIEYVENGRMKKEEFSSRQKSLSKQEAVNHCLNLGAQVVETICKNDSPVFADIAPPRNNKS